MIKGSRITMNGISLEKILADEQSCEIAQHLREEAKTLAVQCGVRRCYTSSRKHLSRSGRPHKAVSVLLSTELDPFLKDETLALRDIADLFHVSLSELRFYQQRLAIRRKRGPKFGSGRAKAA